ncbi:MAG: ABC transporter permease [Myxococcota bacterium]
MRNVWTIAAKEIRIYLTTPVSFALAATFVLLNAFFFERLVVQFQSLMLLYQDRTEVAESLNLTDYVMTPMFFWMVTFLLFVLPLLTMRLFAEERRARTLELLMTAPVRSIEIVLGKFLGASSLMVGMVLLTGLFPLALAFLGTSAGESVLDVRTVLSGYVGVIFAGAAFVSLGMFTSSFTDSQLVAAILSLTLSVLFLIIGLAAPGLEGPWREFFAYVSLAGHVSDFARGLIRAQALVYYASLIGLGVFLSYRVIEAQRWR